MSENLSIKCPMCGTATLRWVDVIRCTVCESSWNFAGQLLAEGPRQAEVGDWVRVKGYYTARVDEAGPYGFTVWVVEPKPTSFPALFVGRNDVVKLDRPPFLIGDKVRVFNSREVGIVTGALNTGVNVHLAERGETVHFDADELEHTS